MIRQIGGNGHRHVRIGRLSNSELKNFKHLQTEETWLNRWTYAQRKKYARQYVAIQNRQVVAANRSLDLVHRLLDQKKLGAVLIARIEDPDYGIIYAF